MTFQGSQHQQSLLPRLRGMPSLGTTMPLAGAGAGKDALGPAAGCVHFQLVLPRPPAKAFWGGGSLQYNIIVSNRHPPQGNNIRSGL